MSGDARSAGWSISTTTISPTRTSTSMVSGAIRARESDFDRDGRIDEIAYYTAGVVVRKDRETNLDGKLDTWDFYEGGKLHHRDA